MRCARFGYRGAFHQVRSNQRRSWKISRDPNKQCELSFDCKVFFPCFKDILYLLYFCSFLYVFVWVISYQQQSQQCLGVCGVPATLSLRHGGRRRGSLYILLCHHSHHHNDDYDCEHFRHLERQEKDKIIFIMPASAEGCMGELRQSRTMNIWVDDTTLH